MLRKKIVILLFVCFLSACTLWMPAPEDAIGRAQLNLVSPGIVQNFERVTEPRDFYFPQDHGPHPSFQTEWWYYTGNLEAESGELFSYQLTIFRRGLSAEAVDRESNFGTEQIYFAHFAIAAIDEEEHKFAERFSRGALGLAGAENDPYVVFIENWQIRALDHRGSHVQLSAIEEDMAIDLQLRAEKPIVIHGDGGVSAKSAEAGNASYYLSYTRMESNGSLTFGGETYEVSGSSWFDHEWSSSALGEGTVGWDWFSLQLDDQQELMLYIMRNEDGTVEPSSAGTLVASDGTLTNLDFSDFSIDVLDRWDSPKTGASYPSHWIVTIPSEKIELEITPTFYEQEMLVSFIYWEGSVIVEGSVNGVPITGRGFVELTGYVESMGGVF